MPLRYPRLTAFLLSSAVFLTAVGAITLLARMPFGEIYATLVSSAQEAKGVEIVLAGCAKPEVQISAVERTSGAYVVLFLQDANTEFASFTLPAEWQLHETRFVNAADVVTYAGEAESTHRFPLHEGKIELRFLVPESLRAVRFRHDSEQPALLTARSIGGESEERIQEARIVERSALVEL